MRLYDRVIAGVYWLQKFTIFSPFNLREDERLKRQGIIQWGNYSIGYNLYPNLFNIFVRYSPSAKLLVKRKLNLIFGNTPKEYKEKRTTYETSFTNTLYNLLLNAGRDYILYEGSFAIWTGYDDQGRIDEFKSIPLESIRYVKRDEEKHPYTDSPYMIAIMGGEGAREISSLYYPYEPERAVEQKQDPETNGQILFYNTATNQTYPDCLFDSMLPVLLADAATDTGLISFLGNSDLLKTYKKRPGDTGADSASGLGGLLGMGSIDNIWGLDRNMDLTETATFGSDYLNTGVKTMGGTEYMNITSEESIENYIKKPEFPAFMGEFNMVDERTVRKLCVALEIPYEYVYKMESGVINQDNREAFIKELNILHENPRNTFEGIINLVLDRSVFGWRLRIPALGEGNEDVQKANENITE